MNKEYRKSGENGNNEPTFWAAASLAKAGYPVFPIGPDKAPSVTGGFYAATMDVSQVAAWIEEGRGHHNVAFATGLPSLAVVIDADTLEAYEKMRKKYGEPHVKTKRGGHWYFKHPQDGKVRSTAVEDGLDCKADGGYVLAPPSKGRTWTGPVPDLGTLPKLPDELRPKRTAVPEEGSSSLDKSERETATETIARHVAGIVQGRRHEHLTHLCGVLLSRGIGHQDAERILVDAWSKVDDDLQHRAPHEIPNTLRTTEAAIAEGYATGVPKMEEITPGLYDELNDLFVWSVPMNFNDKTDKETKSTKPPPISFEPQAGPLGERIFIGKLIREGIEPPAFLEPDVLVEGAVHWLFGASESGKTWLVLWMIKNRLEAGERVLLFDKENGPEIIGERLELLGCDPESIDEHLYYHEEPSLKIEPDTLEAFTDYLNKIQPVLTVFDSARGFLTSAGLEENSNDDLDVFYEALLKPIRNRKMTSVVLDHIPHDGNHARGAGRKKDLTDVMWNVKCLLPFNEGRVGEIKLRREKGRRGAIPETVAFSIGGDSEGGFLLRRSAGTVETEDDSGLTASQHKVLSYIQETGEKGATWSELLAHMNHVKGTLSNAIKILTKMNLITKSVGRYYAKGPVNPEPRIGKPISEGSLRFNQGSNEPNELGTNGEVQEVHSPLGSEPLEPRAEPADIDPQKVVDEFNRMSAGARKNLPIYLAGEITLEILTRSVLYGLDRNPDTWQRYASVVEEAAGYPNNHPVECGCAGCA